MKQGINILNFVIIMTRSILYQSNDMKYDKKIDE